MRCILIKREDNIFPLITLTYEACISTERISEHAVRLAVSRFYVNGNFVMVRVVFKQREIGIMILGRRFDDLKSSLFGQLEYHWPRY